MKLKVRVLNPIAISQTYISRKNAERYVARGRARWEGDRMIKFIEDSHDRRSAERAYQFESQRGYDRIGLMSVEQVAGLPTIGDPMKLFTLRGRYA